MMNLVMNARDAMPAGGSIPSGSQNVRGMTQPNRLHLYFPIAEADAHNRQATPLLPNFVPAGQETILLVEDEEQIRVLACLTLQEAGYTVLVAANGQDALSVALQHGGPLHLLLTDVIMPGMNGAQLNEQIDTLYPTIKTLYISGYVDSKLAFPHLESTSRAAYLPKPFTPTVLTQKVRELLDAQ